MQHKNTPSYSLLCVAISLILGIVVAEGLWLRLSAGMWLSMTLAFLVPACALFRYRLAQSFLLLVCFFSLGGWLTTHRISSAEVALPERSIAYEAIVADCPREDVRELYVVKMDGVHLDHALKVRARMKDANRLHAGDGLVAVSRLRGIRRPAGRQDFYPLYLLCHDFVASTYIHATRWQPRRLSTQRLSVTEKVTVCCRMMRDRLLKRAETTALSGESRALLNAMTIGDRSELTARLRGEFSRSGVSHVLALSGLHFGMVYSLILLLVFPWRRHFMATVFTLLAVWTYAFFVGLSPSVVRSASMLTVYALVAFDHRQRSSVSVLSFVALVVLLLNPLTLFDVSFQLSFISVLSILLTYPLLVRVLPANYLQRHRCVGWVVSLGFISVTAQFATAPLVAYHFGTFSLCFLLANYVVIPLVTMIVPLGIVFFATLFCSWLNDLVVTVLDVMLRWLVAYVHAIQAIPGSFVEELHPTAWLTAASYLMLIILYVWVERKTRQRQRRE